MKHNKWLLTILLAAIFTFTTLITMNRAHAQSFTDVSEKDSYYKAVEHLAAEGVLSTASGKFNPNNQVTRGQLAKMLAISLDLDVKNVKNPNFKDVPTTHQFYPYIAALANKKIINGYQDGTFGVNKPVTKAHLAKFIVNGFEMPIRSELKQSFSDVKPGTEADKYAGTLYFYKITYTPKFNPNSNARRYVVASFIYDAMMKKESIDNQVEIKLPHTATGKMQEYYKHTTTKADASVDILKNVFVLMPKGAERAFYLPLTNNKYKKVQFEVNEQNKVVHISLTDNIAAKYKSYFGVGSTKHEYRPGIFVQGVTFENVSKPSLSTVKGTKGVDMYGRDTWSADIYAAHGDVLFTDMYKMTTQLSDGNTLVNYLENVEKSDEIAAREFVKEEDNVVFLPAYRLERNQPFTVEGTTNYIYNSEVQWDETNSYITKDVGFSFKETGTYKVLQNGKVVLAVEIIELNGELFGTDITHEYLD